MEDREIVELYWLRDEAALAESEKKYGAYCASIARGILGNQADAEECANYAFYAAWRAIPPHRPALLSAFLGKITRRLALKKLRERTAQKRGGGEAPLILHELAECVSTGEDADTALDKTLLTESLNAFLEELSPSERRVFLCRYWYFESVKDIASRFGFGESKVKMMLKRTRDKLSAHLRKEELL